MYEEDEEWEDEEDEDEEAWQASLELLKIEKEKNIMGKKKGKKGKGKKKEQLIAKLEFLFAVFFILKKSRQATFLLFFVESTQEISSLLAKFNVTIDYVRTSKKVP